MGYIYYNYKTSHGTGKLSEIDWNDKGEPSISVAVEGADFNEFKKSNMTIRGTMYSGVYDFVQEMVNEGFNSFELVGDKEIEFEVYAYPDNAGRYNALEVLKEAEMLLGGPFYGFDESVDLN